MKDPDRQRLQLLCDCDIAIWRRGRSYGRIEYVALPAGEVRHESANHHQRREPIRVVIGERPSAVATGRIPCEIDSGGIAVELGERFIHFRSRRLTTRLLPAGCAVGVRLGKDHNRRESVGVQPNHLCQRANRGPHTI